jgi:hypothetical protein
MTSKDAAGVVVIALALIIATLIGMTAILMMGTTAASQEVVGEYDRDRFLD